MQRSIVYIGMKKVHLCFDKQLNDVTIQVCWNQPRKFRNIVLHPARMYIVIFCLHWNLNEMLSLGILCHCSLWRNKMYLQWEIMDGSYETISESYNDFCQLDKILLMALSSTRNSSYTSKCSTLGGQFPPANTSDSPD